MFSKISLDWNWWLCLRRKLSTKNRSDSTSYTFFFFFLSYLVESEQKIEWRYVWFELRLFLVLFILKEKPHAVAVMHQLYRIFYPFTYEFVKKYIQATISDPMWLKVQVKNTQKIMFPCQQIAIFLCWSNSSVVPKLPFTILFDLSYVIKYKGV